MSTEIRPANPEEMEQFYHVARTALSLPPAEDLGVNPAWTLCAFEDGHLATSFGAWPLTMRFNGPGIPVAGVTMVGTLPIYRRRGNLRKIITRHLEMLHERGGPSIAILYASQAAIYQRYGYGIVSTKNVYRVEPRFLQFASPIPVTGTFRELHDSDEDFGVLVDLYRRFRSDKIGYSHRGRMMWKAGVLADPPEGKVLSRFVYEEDGQPLGYTVYAGGSSLTIRDLTWLSPAAYQALWGLYGNMDLNDEIVWDRVPMDDPLPHLLLEPRRLHASSADGLLGRIVDVDRALVLRPYPEASVLSFEVLDELCPWNAGCWRLETSIDGSIIGQTDKGPQLRMPISTLAMLLFGQVSATEAARMGRLEALQPAALPTWDKTMRTQHRPFCADMF